MSRARRPSAGHRRLAAAVVAALLAGLAPLAAPAPQAVAAEAAAVPGIPSLVVAPGDGGVLTAGRALDIEVSVTNTGTTALPAGRLQFSIDSGPVASADYLLKRIADPPERLQGLLLPTTGATQVIAPGATQRIRVREAAAGIDAALTAQSGTRLLYASFENGTSSVVEDAAVTRMARGFTGRIGLGTVLAVTAPATTTGVVDVAEQGALTAPGGEWDAALRAAEADPAASQTASPNSGRHKRYQ